MELRPGYKQTEVGVIPEDWEVVSLKELGKVVRGASPRPAGDPRYFNGSYIPWLTVAALTNIRVSQPTVVETTTHLTEEGAFYSRRLKPRTLIIANSGATLGVAKILGIECCANDGIAALLDMPKGSSPEFLMHFINSKTSYLREVVATGNGQPNLNTALIGRFRVPLPSKKAEQEAIAEALSDADALVESLEELITKKRHLKQGAMQELLTGKKRLPGFEVKAGYKSTEVGLIPEDWTNKSVCELASIKTGPFGTLLKASEYSVDIGVPVISVGEIREGFLRITAATPRVSEGVVRRLSQYVLKKGDIAFGRKGGVERSALVRQEQSGWFLGSDGICVRPNQNCHHEFIAFQFQSHRVGSWLLQNAIGTTMPSLNQGILGKVVLSIPPTLVEQEAIAKILADMDAEIEALEQKLEKARQIKQGMMQELLTGKTRLL